MEAKRNRAEIMLTDDFKLVRTDPMNWQLYEWRKVEKRDRRNPTGKVVEERTEPQEYVESCEVLD